MKKFFLILFVSISSLVFGIDDQEFIDYIKIFNYEKNTENSEWLDILKKDPITDNLFLKVILFSIDRNSLITIDISNYVNITLHLTNKIYNYVYRFDKNIPIYNGISKEPIYQIEFDFDFFKQLCSSETLAIRTFNKEGIVLNTYIFNTKGLIEILKQYDIENILKE